MKSKGRHFTWGANSMSHAAERAVDVLRAWAEGNFPGSVIEMSLFSVLPTQYGFGIAHQGGLTLVWADVTGAEQGPWSVQLSSGLAIDVPDVPGLVSWANDANRLVNVGKYFWRVAQAQNMAAVVYETSLAGVHFDLLFDGPRGPATQAIGSWLRGMQYNNVQSASDGHRELVAAFGGRPFPSDEDGLTTLFVVASG